MLSPSHFKRALLTTFCANILMWYEFSLYVIYSSILSTHFFPNQNSLSSLVHLMFIFSLGFIARPLGTLVLGNIGDRFGRKTGLILSLILMTIPTLTIGFLPSYASIGIAAPILLATLRLLQNFSTGGEFSGTMTYFYEIAPRHLRGLTGSLSFCSSQIGNVISSLEFFFLHRHMSPENLSTWGWRICFIIGGFIGLLGWYLRNSLNESPLFETAKTEGKTSKSPIKEAFSHFKIPMLKAFCLSTLPGCGWYIIFIFSPLYFGRVLGIHPGQQVLINALLLLGSALIMPLFGYLASSPYRKALFITTAVGIMILSLPFYFSAIHFSFAHFIALEIAMILLLTAQFALLPSLLCELFPVRIRYTGVGVSYNFCIVLFGGSAPAVALALTTEENYLLAPAFILIAAAIISLWSYTTLKEEAH
jgi:MHS family proline/betaine transporter-like MFS transporter